MGNALRRRMKNAFKRGNTRHWQRWFGRWRGRAYGRGSDLQPLAVGTGGALPPCTPLLEGVTLGPTMVHPPIARPPFPASVFDRTSAPGSSSAPERSVNKPVAVQDPRLSESNSPSAEIPDHFGSCEDLIPGIPPGMEKPALQGNVFSPIWEPASQQSTDRLESWMERSTRLADNCTRTEEETALVPLLDKSPGRYVPLRDGEMAWSGGVPTNASLDEIFSNISVALFRLHLATTRLARARERHSRSSSLQGWLLDDTGRLSMLTIFLAALLFYTVVAAVAYLAIYLMYANT